MDTNNNLRMTPTRINASKQKNEEPFVDYMADGDSLPEEQIEMPMRLNQIYDMVSRSKKIRQLSDAFIDAKLNGTEPKAMPYFLPTIPLFDEEAQRFPRQQIFMGLHFTHDQWTRYTAERWRDHIFKQAYPKVMLAYVGPEGKDIYCILKLKLDVKFKMPHTEDHLAVYFESEEISLLKELDSLYKGLSDWDGRKVGIASICPLFHDSTARFADGNWGKYLEIRE